MASATSESFRLHCYDLPFTDRLCQPLRLILRLSNQRTLLTPRCSDGWFLWRPGVITRPSLCANMPVLSFPPLENEKGEEWYLDRANWRD